MFFKKKKKEDFLEETFDDVVTIQKGEINTNLTVVPDNSQNIGAREEQQDCFAYSDVYDEELTKKVGVVAILADGMGGLQNGRLASKNGVNTFLETYVANMQKENNIDSALDSALFEANEVVKGIDGAGSTLIGVVVIEGHLYWRSVGDSHLYLFRNKVLRQLNKDHNVATLLDELYRRNEMSYEDVMSHPERKSLTSYLGVDELVKIDKNVGDFPLIKGDKILLCSDGLYNTIDLETIEKYLYIYKDNTAKVLMEKVIEANKPWQDNVTIMILNIE